MNINTFSSWLNDNQGVLAVILFVGAPLGGFIIWLFKTFFFKKPKVRPSSSKKSDVDSLVNAGRDVKGGRDIIGEQHNITTNAYLAANGHNKEQPIIEVKMDAFYSIQEKYILRLSFRNIGTSPGIIYDLQLAEERLQIANITIPPYGEWVSRSFDISNFNILLEKNDDVFLEVIYKNIYNTPGRTIAKVIQSPRADNRYNIKRIDIEEYQTPDKARSKEGGMILLEPLTSEIWDKKF